MGITVSGVTVRGGVSMGIIVSGITVRGRVSISITVRSGVSLSIPVRGGMSVGISVREGVYNSVPVQGAAFSPGGVALSCWLAEPALCLCYSISIMSFLSAVSHFSNQLSTFK